MRNVSLAYNLLLAFVIFLGGQLLGAGLDVSPNQSLSPEGPQLYLRAGTIDPLSQPAPVHREFSSDDQPALQLVQFAGPVKDAWLASLRSCGLGAAGYVPDYAYVVWGTASAIDCLARLAPLRWSGPYTPSYALHPSLAFSQQNEKTSEPEFVDVIVQLYEAPEVEATVQAILDLSIDIKRTPQSFLGYRALAVRVERVRLVQIASLPGVLNIEPIPEYVLTDEIQAQIIAGNLTGDGIRPSGPGYLAWLSGRGFSQDPSDYPIVDVTDDGIDDGSVSPVHADFYQFGNKANPDRLIYNYDWTSDPSAAGTKGHGNLNASIVAGYNNLSGAAYEDVQGYNYGLGINPFGRVAGSKVFSSVWGWDLPNSDFRALVSNTYLSGARISTNSWGSASYGSYTWDDQTYDALVRDAVQTQPGNQEIIVVFSAGNNGPLSGTTGSPGNAKNVLTVGAAESFRPTWTDGCGIGPAGADNANDIANFSSRGPTADGRLKPDLVAPGTHIQGAASQVAGYSGNGICDTYQPVGQTLYGASSGTSHSAPAVAGAASLFYAYYQQHFSASPPSPAMVKAYLSNSARYLDGAGANDTLPSSSQGFGEINLGRAFDSVSRTLVDQQISFTDSGQDFSVEASIQQTDQPVRITLAWTDAPGAPFSAAYVNNLDLEVEIGGQTYRGNVFSGPISTPGGTPDEKNNLESVVLPAGFGGPILVRVRATNIAGDGVPNNGDPTDQDFALVIYNAVQKMGSLQGTVTDQGTGIGLSGATVLAASSNWQYRTSTDAAGAYTLTIPANLYALSAWKFGYSLENVSNVMVVQDQVTHQDISLSASPSYNLSGCIRDQATGQGLAASLSVFGPFGDPVVQTATTREDPCYTLDLPAASYRLHAESLLHLPGERQIDLDGDRTLDLYLDATTLDGLIHGRVTDINTLEPLSDIEISFERSSSPGQAAYTIATGNEGAYELLLPPDTYTASIEAPFYTPLHEGGLVVPQSNLEERDFSLLSPQMSLAPAGPLRFDLLSGRQADNVLQLSNFGSAPLEYIIYKSTGDPYAGGPDPAGYLLLDSRHSTAARYEWIDVSDGTRLLLGDDDEIGITIPFSFEYYGKTSDLLRIGNNGAALFGAMAGQIHYNNQALSLATDYLIAPLWDDIDSDSGWVAYKTVGSAPDRRLVVEWHDRPHFNNSSDGVTFELILYESSHNLKFQYKDVYFDNSTLDQGKSATVGIRGRGNSYLEASFNQPALVDNLALCFQAAGALPCDPVDIPWLVIAPVTGSLDEMVVQPVTIQVDASLAGLGVHQATIRIRGNDPLVQPYIEIPIRLVVHSFELYLPFAGLPGSLRPP